MNVPKKKTRHFVPSVHRKPEGDDAFVSSAKQDSADSALAEKFDDGSSVIETVKVLGSEVDYGEADRNHPKPPQAIDFIEESPFDEVGILDMLRTYCAARKPVLLIGEPGVGKTLLVQIVAQLVGVPLIQKMGGDYSVSKLVGHFELRGDSGATTTQFVPGPLLRAVTNGGFFYLDEIDSLSNDCFDVLHQLLDHRGAIAKADIGVEVHLGDDEMVRKHDDFWFVATCVNNGNRSGLPDDFLDRFRVIEIPRLSEKAQLNHLLRVHPSELETAIRRIVRIAELTRRLNWGKPASFRQVKSAVEDVTNGIPIDYAIDHCLISPNADGNDELTTLRETMAIEKLGTTALLERSVEVTRKIEVNEFNVDLLKEDDFDEDESND